MRIGMLLYNDFVSDVRVRHEPARGNIVGFTIGSGAHRGD